MRGPIRSQDADRPFPHVVRGAVWIVLGTLADVGAGWPAVGAACAALSAWHFAGAARALGRHRWSDAFVVTAVLQAAAALYLMPWPWR